MKKGITWTDVVAVIALILAAFYLRWLAAQYGR